MAAERKWGAARIAVAQNKTAIEKRLADLEPLTMIFDALKPKLGGITYAAFTRQVGAQITGSRKPAARRSNSSEAQARRPADPSPGGTDVGQPRPQPKRATFSFDPTPQQDDREKLVGPRRPRK